MTTTKEHNHDNGSGHDNAMPPQMVKSAAVAVTMAHITHNL